MFYVTGPVAGELCTKFGFRGVSFVGSAIFSYKHAQNSVLNRAVASLTVSGGQEFHFPHFPQIVINFSYFSSDFAHFLSHVSPPGGRLNYATGFKQGLV